MFEPKSLTKLPKYRFGAATDEFVDGADLAEEVWGEKSKENNSGLMMLPYLFRRFGPPTIPFDEFKKLARYCLTTPVKGLYLDLNLCASGIYLSVGYLIQEKPLIKLNDSLSEVKYVRKFHDFIWNHKIHSEEFRSFEEQKRYAICSSLLWYQNSPEMKKLVEEFKSLNKEPEREPIKWRESKNKLRIKYNEALLTTLKDLNKVVFVRDVAININGHVPDKEIDNFGEAKTYRKYE